MENNTAVLDSFILFYIDMKDFLQTKNLNQCAFVEQMIKNCKEKGLNGYNDKVMKNMWLNLISKYLRLKSKGTMEEKENWKYFEILDSCYEESDFSSNKFSETMVWFLIECFLKFRDADPRKFDTICGEVYEEFVKCGYLTVSKRSIRDKWKFLTLRSQHLPNSIKAPYLESVKAFQEKHSFVKMAFTRNLTEQLIKYLTQLKIMCIIHGYDSEKVLNEIQSKFKAQGIYLSYEDIKEKWKKLTNIYKFLTAKGKSDSNWFHFESMKNHFTEEFLNPNITESNDDISKENYGETRHLRPRSKSVGPELYKNSTNLSPEKIHSNKNKCIKRSLENHGKRKYRKKLKIGKKTEETDYCEITKNLYDIPDSTKIPVNDSTSSTEERNLYEPKNVHIININETNIDRNSGNVTINIPSITKQFSDNEFLPLKKRLRMINSTNNDVDSSNKIDTPSGNDKPLIKTTHINENETSSTLEITDTEKLNVKQHVEDCTLEKLDGNSEQPGPIQVPEKGGQESNLLSSHVESTSNLQKSSVVFLVIKMDGSKKFLKKSLVDGSDMKMNQTTLLDNKTHSLLSTPLESDRFIKPNDVQIVRTPSDRENVDNNNESTIREADVIILDDDSVSQENPTEKTKVHQIGGESCDNDVIVLDDEIETHIQPSDNVPTAQNHGKDESYRLGNDVIVLDSANDTESDSNPIESIKISNVRSCQDQQNFNFSPAKCDIENNLNNEFNFNASTSKANLQCNINEVTVSSKNANANMSLKRTWPGFKYVSQVIRGPVAPSPTPKPTTGSSSFLSSLKSPSICGKNEDFDTESILSEAVPEEDGLKDNLLATVIDFQEQNNSEFIEIKNLMKQNNLLQRETNRLLRLLIEQM